MVALGPRLAPAAATVSRPHLILNSERIAALQAARTTIHRDLWASVLASAEQFAAQPIPRMTNASNRYRSFGDTLPALGLAFHLTGEGRHAEAADRWLQALLAVPTWRGSQNLGRSAWVVGSALTYDWLHAVLPAPTLARVRERLLAEGEILMVESSYWRLLSNHCLIETSALGLIGLALRGEVPRAEDFLARARERAELIIEHAPRDGTWGEGVQYWQYGLGYFLRFLEASKTAGDRDYYPRYEWLRQAHDQVEQTGLGQFEIVREGVGLSVRALRPADLTAKIDHRPLRGSATNGRVATLSLAAASAGRTTFLVVLGVRPSAATPPPQVEWAGEHLRLEHGGAVWEVLVGDPRRASDPAAALLHPRAAAGSVEPKNRS